MIEFELENNSTIENFLNEYKICIEKVFKEKKSLEKILEVLLKARDEGKNVYTMGNGGSGSTASHFVSDLLKTTITNNNKRFSAISLVDNISVILAWSNDMSFENIFVEQLRNFLSPGDVIIGFSGSGKSKNILKAFQFGKENGAICVGITGMGGGDFPKVCETSLIVPSNNMLIVESTHLMICHSMVAAIRAKGTPMFNYD